MSAGILETPLTSKEFLKRFAIAQSYKIPIHHKLSPKMQKDKHVKALEIDQSFYR